MAFSGSGSGTSGNPYIITNVDQLQEMADSLSSFYELGNDIDASATEFWSGTFSPVNLTGSFDGKGFTIENIFVIGGNIRGVFGQPNGATIKNLVIKNATISGGLYTGACAGWLIGSTAVSNVAVIESSVTGNSNQLGGVVGFCQSGTVTDCYNDNTSVTSTGTPTTRVGGVIGRGGTAVRCYNTGFISTSHSTYRGDAINGNGSGTNCFWDSQTSNTTVGQGTARTTAQMKQLSTYSSVWDIVGIGSYVDEDWYIDDGVDYPRLGMQFEESGSIIDESFTSSATPASSLASSLQANTSTSSSVTPASVIAGIINISANTPSLLAPISSIEGVFTATRSIESSTSPDSATEALVTFNNTITSTETPASQLDSIVTVASDIASSTVPESSLQTTIVVYESIESAVTAGDTVASNAVVLGAFSSSVVPDFFVSSGGVVYTDDIESGATPESELFAGLVVDSVITSNSTPAFNITGGIAVSDNISSDSTLESAIASQATLEGLIDSTVMANVAIGNTVTILTTLETALQLNDEIVSQSQVNVVIASDATPDTLLDIVVVGDPVFREYVTTVVDTSPMATTTILRTNATLIDTKTQARLVNTAFVAKMETPPYFATMRSMANLGYLQDNQHSARLLSLKNKASTQNVSAKARIRATRYQANMI